MLGVRKVRRILGLSEGARRVGVSRGADRDAHRTMVDAMVDAVARYDDEAFEGHIGRMLLMRVSDLNGA